MLELMTQSRILLPKLRMFHIFTTRNYYEETQETSGRIHIAFWYCYVGLMDNYCATANHIVCQCHISTNRCDLKVPHKAFRCSSIQMQRWWHILSLEDKWQYLIWTANWDHLKIIEDKYRKFISNFCTV